MILLARDKFVSRRRLHSAARDDVLPATERFLRPHVEMAEERRASGKDDGRKTVDEEAGPNPTVLRQSWQKKSRRAGQPARSEKAEGDVPPAMWIAHDEGEIEGRATTTQAWFSV